MSTVYVTAEPEIQPPPRGDELPCDDGVPMETARHRDQMNLLIHALQNGWKARRDFFVGGNMFLYFSAEQARKNDFRGPDVFVVLGTDDHERKSWVVWEENGTTPDVVIELTSKSTEHIDRGEKMKIYAEQLKVAIYVLYDPFSLSLEAYQLDLATKRYMPIEPLPTGDVPCPDLGLSLGVRNGTYGFRAEHPWLRWIAPDGEVLPTEDEEATAKAVEAERKAADAESKAAEAESKAADAKREAESLASRLAEYERRFGTL